MPLEQDVNYGFNPFIAMPLEQDVNYGFNPFIAICDALGLSHHDIETDRKKIELAPKEWIEKKLAERGYTKTTTTP
jgi:hypothetical protein